MIPVLDDGVLDNDVICTETQLMNNKTNDYEKLQSIEKDGT